MEITKEDLLSYQQDNIEQEAAAKERAARNECICGTVKCSTEYACHTSGF